MRPVLTILTILLMSTTWSLAASPEPIGELVEVVYQRTVDGDTIKVSTTERGEIYSVRLFGVDCAEPKVGSAEAFAAAWFTADALENGSAVYLEYDDASPTDYFKRVLAWVWWKDADGQLHLLNLELLDSGNARPYSGTQSKRYL